jgi:glutathione S-transferase
VPGLVVDGEPVHGSRPILARLEQIEPEPALYPEPIAERVREAELWGDVELQDLGRRFSWGALHFRPEAMATYGGAGPLDPAGTDFAIRFLRASWKYHGITCERLADDLAAFPAKVEQIERYANEGVIGGDRPNAADLQIGATIRVLLTVGDVAPLLSGTAAERIALANFPDYHGAIPAGAFPASWIPAAS